MPKTFTGAVPDDQYARIVEARDKRKLSNFGQLLLLLLDHYEATEGDASPAKLTQAPAKTQPKNTEGLFTAKMDPRDTGDIEAVRAHYFASAGATRDGQWLRLLLRKERAIIDGKAYFVEPNQSDNEKIQAESAKLIRRGEIKNPAEFIANIIKRHFKASFFI